MAWSEKLPSGKYRAVYRDAQGRRRSAGTFTHKAEAKRKAAAAEERARKSLWRDGDSHKRPWSEWCEEWWPTRGVASSTEKADRVRRDKHLVPRWGSVPIGSITRQDVRSWAAQLRREGVGPSTVQRIVHLFSASMNAAMDAEVVTANPAARIRLESGSKAQERYLTREEYAAIRDELPTTGHQLVADVLVHTGMRWGEMAGLHRNRLDLGRGMLRVVETFDETDGHIKAYPKGKRVRDVPLTPQLVAALTAEPAHPCTVAHKVGRCRSQLVLATDGGAVLRNSNWAEDWRAAVERSGVGHTRIHDLRHTYASWLLQDGVPLAEVGRLLGHVSTQTTSKYAHLAEVPSAAVLAALAPRLPHAG